MAGKEEEASQSPAPAEIKWNEKAERFETEDREAYLQYHLVQIGEGKKTAMDMAHTFVPRSKRGMGLAAKLCDAAFAHAQIHSLPVIPTCSYISVRITLFFFCFCCFCFSWFWFDLLVHLSCTCTSSPLKCLIDLTFSFVFVNFYRILIFLRTRLGTLCFTRRNPNHPCDTDADTMILVLPCNVCVRKMF